MTLSLMHQECFSKEMVMAFYFQLLIILTKKTLKA